MIIYFREHNIILNFNSTTFLQFLIAKPPEEKNETSSDGAELKKIGRQKEKKDSGEKPKRTRIKPPKQALSLQDRLFYLLQPPLESWLAGQELIMPFEPFGYQYEGIAWLFSQSSALLADEMGLGKTMQTITAIRLLLRSGQARRILLICPKPLIPNWQREFKTWAEELQQALEEKDQTDDPGIIRILDQDIDLARRVLATIDRILGPEDPETVKLKTIETVKAGEAE